MLSSALRAGSPDPQRQSLGGEAEQGTDLRKVCCAPPVSGVGASSAPDHVMTIGIGLLAGR